MAAQTPIVMSVLAPLNNVIQNAFPGIAASAVTTANVATGSTYYGMQLSIPGATVAQIGTAITRVVWTVDGETLLDMSASNIQTVNATEGFTNRDGELLLPIVPRYMRDYKDTVALGVGLGRSATSTLQVTLGATITGVTSIGLVTQSTPDSRPLGEHRRLLTAVQPITAAGSWALDLQRPGNALLKNLHICNGANVTSYNLRVNQNLIRNVIPTAIANGAFNRAGYLPQTNTVSQTMDEFQAGVGGLALVGVTDLNLTTTVSGAPSGNVVQIVQDYIWNFGQQNV